ncbi:MAG: L,D-transpeptidase family protein [Neptuniibacter sp.]
MLQIQISLTDQILRLYQGNTLYKQYSVSTALKGAGEQKNSGCTPRGKHYVRAMIGHQLPENAVLVGRRFTGEIYDETLAAQYPHRDWILTRILWLSGVELEKNRLGDVDTMQRYIYIHGTPDSEPMGIALSHGCIRMRNDELIEFFELVKPGTSVNIEE